jgi:hypothetical protein
MATSKNSPTAAETGTDTTSTATPTGNVAESGATPVVSDGEVSEARVEETNNDYAIQNPPPPAEDVAAEEAESEAAVIAAGEEESDAEAGETWVKYLNTNHTRGFTLADQRRAGVVEDKLVDNTEDATPQGLEVSLEPGVYWTLANRHRVNATDFPPALMFLVTDNPDFEVQKY